MYPTQQIFHQFPQVINSPHGMVNAAHAHDPQMFHSYVMPQTMVQQPVSSQISKNGFQS